MCNELSTCLLLSFFGEAFFARMLLQNCCDDNAGVCGALYVRTTHDAYVLIVHQSTHTQVSHHHTESVSCVASICMCPQQADMVLAVMDRLTVH